MQTQRPEWRPASKTHTHTHTGISENVIIWKMRSESLDFTLLPPLLHLHLSLFISPPLFLCPPPSLFPSSLLPLSGPTGVWGTTSQGRPTLSTTLWSPRTRRPFSPAWRALAAWPHFPRATAPRPPLKRASSNQRSPTFLHSRLPLSLENEDWCNFGRNHFVFIRPHVRTYTPPLHMHLISSVYFPFCPPISHIVRLSFIWVSKRKKYKSQRQNPSSFIHWC